MEDFDPIKMSNLQCHLNDILSWLMTSSYLFCHIIAIRYPSYLVGRGREDDTVQT